MRGFAQRLRWRWRGAWMWPAFVLTLGLDATIGHLLPPAGDSQRVVGAAVLACFLNLGAILLLARPLGALIRRRRPDMPRLIARDYGGTLAVAGVSALLLLAGLLHHPTIDADRAARQDAIVRAQAYIGDRAPEPFRHDVTRVDVFAIEPGTMYRVCVPAAHDTRSYCVIVDAKRPFPDSVTFAGYESNEVFAQGTG